MNQTLEQLRNLARYRYHGGYTWAAIMSDGALLCVRCVRDNYRQVFTATRDRGVNAQWQCEGVTDSGGYDGEGAYCCHCDAVLFDSTEQLLAFTPTNTILEY